MQVIQFIGLNKGASGHETWVLANKDSRVYLAMKKTRNLKHDLEHDDLPTWTDPVNCKPPEEVDLTTIYPPHHPHYSRLVAREGEAERSLYMKQVRYLDKACRQDLDDSILAKIGDVVARDIAICERLKAHPHTNVVEYRGVFSQNKIPFTIGSTFVEVPLDIERVLGIWYARYDCTLYDLVARDEDFDVRHCLESIAKGIEHLHALGIVHCDTKPHNIFVKRLSQGRGHQWVIGDFDSAHEAGARIRLKAGSKHFMREKSGSDHRAYTSDDWYSFQKVKKWLVCHTGGTKAIYGGIGKVVAKE